MVKLQWKSLEMKRMWIGNDSGCVIVIDGDVVMAHLLSLGSFLPLCSCLDYLLVRYGILLTYTIVVRARSKNTANLSFSVRCAMQAAQ
jgi:hypothetical protein